MEIVVAHVGLAILLVSVVCQCVFLHRLTVKERRLIAELEVRRARIAELKARLEKEKEDEDEA